MGQVVGTFHPRLESFFDYILFSIYVDVLWSHVSRGGAVTSGSFYTVYYRQ